jgi:hypothetical protein
MSSGLVSDRFRSSYPSRFDSPSIPLGYWFGNIRWIRILSGICKVRSDQHINLKNFRPRARFLTRSAVTFMDLREMGKAGSKSERVEKAPVASETAVIAETLFDRLLVIQRGLKH